MRSERTNSRRAARADILFVAPWAPIEQVLFAAICAVTLFFTIVTPPFQAPDENQHYLRALWLSEGHVLTQTQAGLIGAELPRAAIDLHDVDFPTDLPGVRRSFDRAAIVKAGQADESRPGTRFAEFPNVASYAPTLYAPGAAGILIGDAIGLPRIGAFYAGRIVNALVALALLAVALRVIPFGRYAMLAVAALPTTAYQTGSLSPDAFINAIGFFGLALALRWGFGEAERRRGIALAVTAPLLALCKGVYLPLMAAGLRLPARARDMRPWVLLGTMALGAAVFVGWMKYSGGTQALYSVMSRTTGEHMLTAPLAEQLAVVLRDPVAFARILIASVVERAPVYLLQIVGRFGWNAILLPMLAYPVAGLMLGAAVASGSGERFGIVQRVWWLAIVVGVALLIETAMYLTATPLAADYIQGTQGRYFLPVLPLALIALMPERGTRAARIVFTASALALLAIAALTVMDSFWFHGFVTDDGMPRHDDLIEFLLLPSPRW